ncbi:hypothetical protein KZX46_10945 [Polymorphobacter sp. PAMC 29334]|uniref:hypothetical protein n=1 Tax=Polymorphobacter sp. PAMC 29334 TaxID=2862331 RepID=UPI001C757719|nr:hypothetical protein [Polymorphobacter sp. PAMC 29334]QYE36387.1 hypothetical protein KZX46_10945 [Polymorphobacter sp. PAMC 29334]
MSEAVEALRALSVAQGNRVDNTAHEAEPRTYAMLQPMPDDVRTAGGHATSLSYAQTMGEEHPREGFIDEADETLIMFPFPPGVVEAARREARRGTSWQRGLAIICVAVGVGELLRALTHPPISVTHCSVALLFLIAAPLLFRRGRMRDERA